MVLLKNKKVTIYGAASIKCAFNGHLKPFYFRCLKELLIN